MEELEQFLLKEIESKMNLNEEVYALFPILGKKNYIQRLNPHGDSERYNMRYEMLLAMATSIIDPELDLARVVTGVIFANPLFQFGTGDRITEILNEILEPRFEKRIDGFGELFRSLSYNEIGTSAMLYRATAGILRSKKKGKVVFLLPDSPDAVKRALQLIIIPELEPILSKINKEE